MVAENSLTEGTICLKLEYQNSENPAKIFSVLSELVTAFNEFDAALIHSISPNIGSSLVLGDIQTGSIKAFFRNLLLNLDDDGLKNLDWKKIVGNYLYVGKYKALKLLQENQGLPIHVETGLPDRSAINNLADELLILARNTDVKAVPSYQRVSVPQVLKAMFMVAEALGKLHTDDRVIYTSSQAKVELSPAIVITPEMVEEFLIKESKKFNQTYILKVKKPDYLGESQWEFKYNRNLIKAKITDVSWLHSFQERHITVRPGDSIEAQVEVTVNYGFEGEIVSTHYNVFNVLNVINRETTTQFRLLELDISTDDSSRVNKQGHG